MEDQKQLFRIVVVEDSEFFNNLLTRQLQNYVDTLALDNNCRFEIQSYTSAADALRNLNEDTDIAFVDYYLGNGFTADDVLDKFKQKCRNCKVVVISQVRNMKTSIMSISKGAIDFIFKDINALPRACFIVEDLVDQKLAFRKN
jgi:DNA-binding NtrC family response regulator